MKNNPKIITISLLVFVIGLSVPMVYAAEGDTLSEICDRKTDNEKNGFEGAVCKAIDEIKGKFILLEDSIIENSNDIDDVDTHLSEIDNDLANAIEIAERNVLQISNNTARIADGENLVNIFDDRITDIDKKYEQNIFNHFNRMNVLEDRILDANGRITDIDKKYEQNINNHFNRMNVIEDKVLDNNRSITVIDGIITVIDSRITINADRITDNKNELIVIDSEFNTIEDRFTVLEADALESQRSITKLKVDRDVMVYEIDELKSLVRELQADVDRLEQHH